MTRSRRATVLLLATLASGSAYADPPQSASDPCRARHPGDPCEADEFEGICKRRRCTRETDDGVRTFHCLVCESRHHHSSHRAHHRRDSALDASADDVADASADDVTGVAVADDVSDAAREAAAPRVFVRSNVQAPPRRNLLECAARPGSSESRCAAWAVLAVAGVLARRVRSRGAAASEP